MHRQCVVDALDGRPGLAHAPTMNEPRPSAIKVGSGYAPAADPRVVLDLGNLDDVDTLDADRNGYAFVFSIIDDRTGHTITVDGLDGARRIADAILHKISVARAMEAEREAAAERAADAETVTPDP